MDVPNIKPEIKTDIKVSPSKSQVFLVALVVLAAICFIFGFYYLIEKPDISWVPIFIGIVLIMISYGGWSKSQKDTDLSNSLPTTISNKDGAQISTDSRTLSSIESVNNLARLVASITERKPLPEPSGVIDGNGQPIQNSQEQAKIIIDEVNSFAQEITNEIVDFLGVGATSKSVEQPLIDEPKSDALIKTNVAPKQA